MGSDTLRVFDVYCKTVIRNAANDYFTTLARRRRYEVMCSEIPNTQTFNDTYFNSSCLYRVFDGIVPIHNQVLVSALNQLTAENRLIVLAVCCSGMTDQEVATRLNMVRRTVAYRRKQSLIKLRGAISANYVFN